MEEEVIETQDAYIEDDKTSTNETPTQDDLSVEEIKAKMAEMEKTIKTLTIQKKKAQEKATKTVDIKQPQIDESEISSLKERLDLRDFRDSHSDLDAEDIKEIHTIAKANGKTLEEALSLNIVKGYLANKQEMKKIELASISNNRSPKGSDNKPLFREGLSKDEHEKAWSEYMIKNNLI